MYRHLHKISFNEEVLSKYQEMNMRYMALHRGFENAKGKFKHGAKLKKILQEFTEKMNALEVHKIDGFIYWNQSHSEEAKTFHIIVALHDDFDVLAAKEEKRFEKKYHVTPFEIAKIKNKKALKQYKNLPLYLASKYDKHLAMKGKG